MAVAVQRRGQAGGYEDERPDIIEYYRRRIAETPPPKYPEGYKPEIVGPTWRFNDAGWVLPQNSMGWETLAWCSYWLRKGDDNWIFTPEQARFILWWDSVSENGHLNHRTAVFQRLKGHGKDPMGAAMLCAHAFAPVIFDHWGDDGQPVGREYEAAWAQVSAVSKDQAQNTFKVLPGLLGPEVRAHYGIQVGRENVWGLGDTRHIEAVSGNYFALEGNRTTFALRNEPEMWNASNHGHELAGVIDGNTTKIVGGLGRVLDIQNAHRPGEDSVAERVREAWEATQATRDRSATAVDFGLLFDSLEAAPDAELTLDEATQWIEIVKGDSDWLDTSSIIDSIANGSNTPSESRRKWFNQTVATADAWTTIAEFDACFRDEHPSPGDSIVMFGDGSKSDDNTAIVGCRLSDGLIFPIGIWQPKTYQQGGRTHYLPVDRAEVDLKVRETMETYDVHGFWWDPSAARDEETGERFWEPYMDGWAKDYQTQLRRLPAVKTGPYQHLVNWDMRSPVNTKIFTQATERALGEIVDGTLFHNCPSPSSGATGFGVMLRTHVINCRRRPGKFGISVGKEHKGSRKKIDGAVCMIGARMMFHQLKNQPLKGRTPGDGSVVTFTWGR